MKPINLGKFITLASGEQVYVKHCRFHRAILHETSELSLPLTIFEDIRKRGVKKIRFVNIETTGELACHVWDFDFDYLDKIKRETKMYQETQYYFKIKDRLPPGFKWSYK